MKQSEQILCPVCGQSGKQEGRCPRCGLEHAFCVLFAGEQSLAFRSKQIDAHKAEQFAQLQRRFCRDKLFSLAEKSLILRDPESNELIRLTHEAQKTVIPDAVQFSASRSHELVLFANGTVRAAGNNSFGQTVVSDLREIAFVLASGNASYAVGRNGRVTVSGTSPFARIVGSWEQVQTLAAGDHHILALTRSGQVLNAGDASAPEALCRPLPWSDVEQIACAGNYALALTKAGTVLFAGFMDRPEIARWKNVVSIAADDMYAVALTADGSLLLSGEGGFLDRGRSCARQWKNVVAVAASGGCIGAVSGSGELHLAGGYFANRLTGSSPLARLWAEESRTLGLEPGPASLSR